MAKEPAGVPQHDTLQLVHPVYLDTPMMVSFVAALEGGVAYGDERTQRMLTAADREREGSARFGIPILSSLLSLDMTGRLGAKDRQEGEEEVKVVRRHTEASLFNLLRHRLRTDGQIASIGAAGLGELVPGQLIEISGEVVGNPLEQLFNLMRRILPYLGIDEEELRKPKKSGQKQRGNARSGNPAKRAQGSPIADAESSDEDMSIEDVVRMLFIMRDDLDDAAVRDLVLIHADGMKAVLTLATEFLTNQTTDFLLGGRFTVLGKVTSVLEEDETINLTRRTALGLAGPETARGIVQSFTTDNDLFVEISDPIVEWPAVQILPLALFV